MKKGLSQASELINRHYFYFLIKIIQVSRAGPPFFYWRKLQKRMVPLLFDILFWKRKWKFYWKFLLVPGEIFKWPPLFFSEIMCLKLSLGFYIATDTEISCREADSNACHALCNYWIAWRSFLSRMIIWGKLGLKLYFTHSKTTWKEHKMRFKSRCWKFIATEVASQNFIWTWLREGNREHLGDSLWDLPWQPWIP